MSYLDTPRLHITGSFFTNPSTMDNDPSHYDPAVTRPSPWQEPDGQHHFKILGCTVKSVTDQNGNLVVNDPIVGAAFSSVDTPAPAKLVDLDVYQQGASTVYGLTVSLDCGGGLVLSGLCDPPVLIDAWFNAVLPERSWSNYGNDSPGGDANAAGTFLSVIRIPEASWGVSAGSPMVQALRAASAVVDGNVVVSFHFTLDAYIIGADTPELPPGTTPAPGVAYRRFGRFMAAIGPWFATDPIRAAGPRRLYGRALSPKADWWVPSANSASFKVDPFAQTLTIDMSNALCRTEIGGPPADLGTLTAYAGSGSSAVAVGPVPYQTMFDLTAAVYTVPIPPAAMNAAITLPLSLVSSRTDIGDPTIWTEPSDGVVIASDMRAFRMTSEPGSPLVTQNVPVYVTQFGQPAANVPLLVVVVPVEGNTPGITVPPGYPGDTPSAQGALTATVTPTDANGLATMTLAAVNDPGSRTPLLDGQLYFIYPYTQGQDPTNAVPEESQVNVLLWSSYTPLPNPQWSDIQSMMEVYDKLFPAMRNIISLTDQFSFTTFMNNPSWYPVLTNDPNYNVQGVSRGAICWYMTRDINDPTFMPVTRDLSPNKIATILTYVFNNPVVPTVPPRAPSTNAT